MLCKVFSGAILATFLGTSILSAQSIAQLGGPANLPPASFKGQQFVDSRGCLYLRAGFGNQVNWVPRVNRTHAAMCGLPPTFGARVAAAEAPQALAPQAPPVAAPSPGPQPTIVTNPSPAAPATPAPQVRTAMAAPSPPPGPTIFAKPATPAQPTPAPQVTAQRPAQFVPSPGPKPTMVAGPKPAAPPVQQPRQGNGLGFLFAAQLAPAQPAPAPSTPLVVYIPATPVVTGPPPPIVVARTAIPAPPKGYKLAWRDDRLNPQRAQGTAAGQAAQNQVWSQTTPMVLLAVAPQAQARVQTSVSTMSAPQTRTPATGATYIQIGSFGQPANASAAATRLSGLGLPVASTSVTRSGKALQIVYAGPFASAAAGFADAFVK